MKKLTASIALVDSVLLAGAWIPVLAAGGVRSETIQPAQIVPAADVAIAEAQATNATRNGSGAPSGRDSGPARDGSAPASGPATTATPATSPQEQQSSTGLPVVTVTAHGFAVENFKLPAVDTVITSSDLSELQNTEIRGAMDLVPGVTYTQSQQAGLSFISIRGISQNRNTTSPVVTRLDGVNEIDPEQFNQATYDIDKIQVIKGPEGALYGSDAVAGAILIDTKNPTNYFTGYARVGEGDFGQRTAAFGVGGPILNDALQFRLAGQYTSNDGFFRNVTLQQNENPQERSAARLKLRWLPAENLTLDLSSSYERTLGTANFFHYTPAILTPNGFLAPGVAPFDFSNIDANQVSRTFYNNNLGGDDYSLHQDSLKVTYDGLSFARLEWTAAYDDLSELTLADEFPYTASTTRNTIIGPVDGTQTQYFSIRAWTGEVRLTSKLNAVPRLHWLFGLYYSYVDRFISSTTGTDNGLGIIPLFLVPQFNSPANPTGSFLADDNHNYTKSVLGNIGYDLPLGFSIDLADRWDKVDKNQFVSIFNTAGVPGAINRGTFQRQSPRATLQWLPTEGMPLYGHLSLYATYGEGFRAGGFNQNGVGAAAAAIGLSGVGDRIEEEIARTAELGFKSRWLGDRLEVDGDVYRIRDTNQPFFVFVGAVGAQILINIDQARMYGGDLGVRGQAFSDPTWGSLSLYASGNYNKNYITQYRLNPADVGNNLPQAPVFLWQAGFAYQRHLFDNNVVGPVSLFTRWDFSGRRREAWDADNSSFQKGYTTLDLHFGFKGERVSLMASILNLTDEKYNEEFVEGGFTEPALPRSAMVTLIMNFGE